MWDTEKEARRMLDRRKDRKEKRVKKTRIELEIPITVKLRADVAAEKAGMSLNDYIVHALETELRFYGH